MIGGEGYAGCGLVVVTNSLEYQNLEEQRFMQATTTIKGRNLCMNKHETNECVIFFYKNDGKMNILVIYTITVDK